MEQSIPVHHSSLLDWRKVERHSIAQTNWNEYDYSPSVTFAILHCDSKLYINFEVEEKYAVRCQETIDQSPVYQDSCVEFFFLKADGDYVNFEANAKGVILAACGKERAHRKALSQKELNTIERYPSGIEQQEKNQHWQLTLGIPFDILGVTVGKTYFANFYKCGDLTEKKHYLSWSPISTDKPDFHRPEFFGKITLE